MKRIPMLGLTFGKLKVISEVRVKKGRVLCVCKCGSRTFRKVSDLRRGKTSSCGCDWGSKRTRHGMWGTRTYRSWHMMIQRATNPNDPRFADYGGRGIEVCDRWRDFENFYADMGLRPDGKSIDRIDVDGDYEPSNCRWATPSEQQRNRRKK